MTFETSSNIPLYDSSEITGGMPLSAHIVRELARSSNALIGRPQLSARWTYNPHYSAAGGEAELSSYARTAPAYKYSTYGEAEVRWKPIFHRKTAVKMPHHTHYQVKIRGVFDNARVYNIQLLNDSNAIAGVYSRNVVSFTGSGSEQTIEFTQPSSVGSAFDQVRIDIRFSPNPKEDNDNGYALLSGNFGTDAGTFAKLGEGLLKVDAEAPSTEERQKGMYIAVYDSLDGSLTGSVSIAAVVVYGCDTRNEDATVWTEYTIERDTYARKDFYGRDFRVYSLPWFQPYSATIYSCISGS